MGDVLHLHDAHEQAQMLLPWRVSGKLEPGEAALFDAHAEQCEECRADLAVNLELRELYTSMPADVPPRQHLPDALLAPHRLRFLRRRVSVGWALAGQAALAAAAAAVLLLGVRPEGPPDDYRLLGSDGAAQDGNAIVLFSPDMTERELRTALIDAGAQVVRGPTASGAFVVRVDQASRTAVLGKLRANGKVLLAEPIDPSNGP